MITIYLDKQVFSHLFNAREEKYSTLRDKILAHGDEFIFTYSNAHLFDLKTDETDIKYDEMNFMESVVHGNYLIYEDFKLKLLNQSPKSAFDGVAEISDFSWIDDIDLSKLTQEQISVINNVFDIGYKDLTGQLEPDWLTKREPIFTDKLNVDKTTFDSFIKYVEYHFYKNIESYKLLRDKTTKKYNPASIITKENNTHKKIIESNEIEKSFLELIKQTLTQIGLPSHNSLMFYYVSYMMLDLLGYNKDKRKKVRFKNLQIDSVHSFFGSFCDCIVSDDEGVRNKTKILYDLFKINTQVYSIDEFIKRFDEAIENNQKSAEKYFEEIWLDYSSRQVIKSEIKSEFTINQLKTTNKYLGYFDCMIERISKDENVIIMAKNTDANRPLFGREVEIIVNRFVRIFNSIGADSRVYNNAVEFPQMKADNWYRLIELSDSYVCLTKFKDVPQLCMWIKLKDLS